MVEACDIILETRELLFREQLPVVTMASIQPIPTKVYLRQEHLIEEGSGLSVTFH